VFLILADLGQHFWGTGFRAVPLASALTGKVTISGATFPVFDLLIIGVAILVGVALWLMLRHSVFGWRVRAAVDDPELLQSSGVDLRRLQMGVFALGALLAGLGGAIVAPQTVVAPGIDESIIVAAFLVCVIGGLGSVLGTALGALIIAFAQTVGAVVAPTWASTFTFLAAIIVLAVRPAGLLGVPER
jgi:branched-subunit amino acid ABC-type transport system permease component